MMSTFFFSFIPGAQVIDPILPMPVWIFTAVPNNVAKGEKDPVAVTMLGLLDTMEG